MAYSTTNPPRLMIPAMGGPLAANSTSVAAGGAFWHYNTSDGSTLMEGAGYFTNGKDLGMRNGDVLFAVSRSTESDTGHIMVIGVLGTTLSTAGWNLSTDGTLTSTFA
jgi:hypothetical protein